MTSMSEQHRQLHAAAAPARLWHLIPVLAAAVALNIFFVSPRGQADAVAAEPAAAETMPAAHHALLLPPSPQPGIGEPALVAEQLPASY